MSEDASYELQRAIYAALAADPAISAAVDGRIYDRVPESVAFPYIAFGPEVELPDRPDCIDAADITLHLDVWSQDPGRREAKRIAAAVVAALDVDALPLGDNALADFYLDRRRVFTDPDGLTTQVSLTFSAAVEKR